MTTRKTTLVDELVQSCRSAKAVTDGEKIATGRTVWFEGSAAPAEAGTIALDTSEGARIIIRREDVRSVESGDKGYLVEVDEGAETIVRFERVVKAQKQSCACHDDQSPQPPEGTAARLSDGGYFWYCYTEIRYICSYVTDSRGVGRVICIPFPKRKCMPMPLLPPMG